MNMAGKGMQNDLFKEVSPKKKKNHLLPKTVAAIIFAGIVGVFLFSDDDPTKPVAMPKTTAASTKATTPASSIIQPTESTITTVPAATIEASKPGSSARALIAEFKEKKGAADLEQIIKSAAKFSSQAMLVDAYLLYFFAARRGDAEAALVLARMNDPAYHSKQTSIMDKPDLTQAYKWYQQAARGGQASAQQDLDDFRARIEQTSANSKEAKQLSLQWQ